NWLLSRIDSAQLSKYEPTIRVVKKQNLGMLQCDALSVRGIFRSVDIEEGIDRLVRPVGNRDTMPRGPHLDLAQVFIDQRLSQILEQRQRPKPHPRVTPFARARARQRYARSHIASRLVQAFNQIIWQERTIARDAEDPFNAALLLRLPVKPGENSGKRAGEIR